MATQPKTYLLLSNLIANGTKYVAGDLLESGLELVNYEQLINSNIIKAIETKVQTSPVSESGTTNIAQATQQVAKKIAPKQNIKPSTETK